MNSDILELREFDMSWVKDDKVCVFIGKRETGKSFCVKDLLFHHQHIPTGIVISSTEEANRFYGNFIPPIFIYYEYTPEIINNLITRQKEIFKKKQTDTYRYKALDTKAFLILDDLMFDTSWISSQEIKQLFMNGRHYTILFCITMQYPLGIPPMLRTNIDYVFLMRENIHANKKRLYENYGGMFPSLDVFCQVLDNVTENYGCLVIHNNSKSNKIEDQVFWYKAKDHDDFKLCDKKSWEFSQSNFVENDKDEFEYKQAKPKFKVIVKKT